MALFKRTKKIAKLGILLTIREAWGAACNLYLLTYQPFLTLRTLRATKDRSQMVWVGMVALLPLMGYSLARIITDYWWYGTLLTTVGEVFMGVLVLEGAIFGYLTYWTYEVLRKNHKDTFLK